MLVTSRPDVLLPTVRSRCQRLRFGRLAPADVAAVLMAQHQYAAGDAHAAASLSDGSIGRALEGGSDEFVEAREAAAALLETAARRTIRGAGSRARRRWREPHTAAAIETSWRAGCGRWRRCCVTSGALLSRADERCLANADLRPLLQRLLRSFDGDRALRAFSAVDRALVGARAERQSEDRRRLARVPDLAFARIRSCPPESRAAAKTAVRVAPLIYEADMSSGPLRPFVSVKFSPVGRTYSFLLPELALDRDGMPATPEAPMFRLPPRLRRELFGPAIRSSSRPPRAARSARSRVPSPRSPSARRRRRIPSCSVVRRATRDDVVTRLKQQQREQEAQRICLMKIRERGLAMKLARVEQLFDGSRLIFYYTAEGRVDFRELVRDLAAHFRIADRDAADRRARRGADARRLRIVRPSAVLHDLAAVVRAHLDQDGEAAEPEPEPVEAVGHVRPAEVLPALRAAERQRREARRLRRRRRLRTCGNPTGPGGRRRRDAATCWHRAAAGLAGVTIAAAGRHHRRAIRPGIGPEIARKAAADPARVGCCEPVLYGPSSDATLGAFARGRVSAAAGRAAYDAIVAAVARRAGRPRSTRSPPRRSTRRRSPRPDCRGAATPICSPT